MLFWIIVGVVFLAYLFVAYMATKTWHVAHVVLMVGVFLFAGMFMILAAMTLRTQATWRKQHDQLVQQLETAEAETARLVRGDLLQLETDLASIPGLDHALRRSLINRGRVWRGALPTQVQGGQLGLNMQGWGDDACGRVGLDEELDAELPVDPADPAPPAASASRPHEIAKDTILFVFVESPPLKEQVAALYGDSELPQKDTKGSCRLPTRFVGRFQVKAVQDQSIQLESVYPLSEPQQGLLANAVKERATCVLYEVMPKDGHEVFEGMDEQGIKSVFQSPAGLEPGNWDRIVNMYLRDGDEAKPEDPDLRKWSRVKILKDIEINVDAGDEEISLDRAFDAAGRAVLPLLKQGGPTKLKKDEEVLLHHPTAQELVQNGAAELTDDPPIYRRPLRDFELLVHRGEVELESQRQLEVLLAGDKGSIELATQKARDQIQSREKELVKCHEDRDQFSKELATIQAIQRELSTKYQMQRRELSLLYQTNLGLRDQIMQRALPVSSRSLPATTLRLAGSGV